MKKRKPPFYSHRTRPHVDLDNIPDTSNTSIDPAGREDESNIYHKSVKVPPPFKGEMGSKFVERSELALTYKTAAIIAGIFVFVGVPIVWFASSLNSNVEVLQGDMKDIKLKTETLAETVIKQDNRLDALEKITTNKNLELNIQRESLSTSRMPKK